MGCASGNISAQSKKETKQYNKAVVKGTIEGYEAFRSKFPNSVYIPKVEHFIDSILFSGVDTSDLTSCVKFISEYPESGYIGLLDERVRNLALQQRYVQDNSLTTFNMIEDFKSYEFVGNSYYYYVYSNTESANTDGVMIPGMKCEYVVNMLDMKSGIIHSSMFSGKVIKADSELGYMIEGDYMDEANGGGLVLPEATHLLGILKNTEFLLQISQSDVMTDQAIEWWNKNNPSNAGRLKFGLLPKESSIVQIYQKQDEYQSSGGYKVAQFDVRGYTVIAAYQKSSDQYMLVWAEPVCKDKNADPLLNSIYFENSNSLVLYYYKGRTTYKVRINMANKTIRR
jgi:hypothetical protein